MSKKFSWVHQGGPLGAKKADLDTSRRFFISLNHNVRGCELPCLNGTQLVYSNRYPLNTLLQASVRFTSIFFQQLLSDSSLFPHIHTRLRASSDVIISSYVSMSSRWLYKFNHSIVACVGVNNLGSTFCIKMFFFELTCRSQTPSSCLSSPSIISTNLREHVEKTHTRAHTLLPVV